MIFTEYVVDQDRLSSSMGDWETYRKISRLMSVFGYTFNGIEKITGQNIITGIGTDLLSTSIWFNAETKIGWFDNN